MKQFIICPYCGSIELAEIQDSSQFHTCDECQFLVSGWKPAKAISIRQPWAYLIASGIKDIENRTWKLPEKHKGKRVLIHTGIKTLNPMWLTDEQMKLVLPKFTIEFSDKKLGEYMFPTSAIIGSVEIVDCTMNYPSIWADKYKETIYNIAIGAKPIYNWILKDPILFEKPILNVKGKLSFFTPLIPNE